MSTSHDPFFTPADINGVRLRSRFALAPMTRVSATEDGSATAEMGRYYERFARGGFGLLITEGVYTDRAFAQGYVISPASPTRPRRAHGVRPSRPSTATARASSRS